MTLDNKLGFTGSAELAHDEELLTKRRALKLFDEKLLNTFEAGTFGGLTKIHGYLFQDVHDFAGEMRTVNIAKGNFRFAPSIYLPEALETIGKMPQSTFDEIIEKYIEMNVAHPFREGNGRATLIWLDAILKKELGFVMDWSLVEKGDYLLAMERSPIRSTEIKSILKEALTDKVDDRQVYMKGIDASYSYEGYSTYCMDSLNTVRTSGSNAKAIM